MKLITLQDVIDYAEKTGDDPKSLVLVTPRALDNSQDFGSVAFEELREILPVGHKILGCSVVALIADRSVYPSALKR